jgi:hypothetical protein
MNEIRATIEKVAEGFPAESDDYIILRITSALGVVDIRVLRSEFLLCVLDLTGDEIIIDKTTTYKIRKGEGIK